MQLMSVLLLQACWLCCLHARSYWGSGATWNPGRWGGRRGYCSDEDNAYYGTRCCRTDNSARCCRDDGDNNRCCRIYSTARRCCDDDVWDAGLGPRRCSPRSGRGPLRWGWEESVGLLA